jgi:hypothetical protein
MPEIAVLPVLGVQEPADDTSSGESPDIQDLVVALDPDQGDTAREKRGEVEKRDNKAKAGPPRLDDWQDFISRIVIRTATNFYMDYALRDIDPAALTPSEIVELRLTTEDCQSISKPFAELANKLPFTRKHGRMIIASADSIESGIVLWKWSRRVSRVGNRHRPKKEKNVKQPAPRKESNGHGNIGNGSTIERPSVVFGGYEGN